MKKVLCFAIMFMFCYSVKFVTAAEKKEVELKVAEKDKDKTKLSDMFSPEELKTATMLNLRECKKLTDISALKGLTKLGLLNLGGV